jgi:replicative DNA helicase
MQNISHSHPANLDAERAVLGAVLESGDILSAVLHENLAPADFSVTDHQQLWEVFLNMSDAGLPVDPISVCDFCPSISLLALSDLTFGVVLLESHVLHCARIVKRKAKARRLLRLGAWLCTEASAAGADPDSLVNELNQKISAELRAGSVTNEIDNRG